MVSKNGFDYAIMRVKDGYKITAWLACFSGRYACRRLDRSINKENL